MPTAKSNHRHDGILRPSCERDARARQCGQMPAGRCRCKSDHFPEPRRVCRPGCAFHRLEKSCSPRPPGSSCGPCRASQAPKYCRFLGGRTDPRGAEPIKFRHALRADEDLPTFVHSYGRQMTRPSEYVEDESSGERMSSFRPCILKPSLQVGSLPFPTSVVSTDARTQVAFRAAGRCLIAVGAFTQFSRSLIANHC